MEALLHGLPFYIILGVVVQGIRRSPPSRGATLRKEGLEAKFEFCLFTEVERIYLCGRRGVGASISVTVDGCKTGATFSSSRSSLKKKAALWAWKSGPRSSSWQVGIREGSCILLAMSTAACAPETGGEVVDRPGRMPRARAAASEAGRLAARDEMIFLRNL